MASAGLLPVLKKPLSAIGKDLHVPGAFWDNCPAADKGKIYVCNIREFNAVHRCPGGAAPWPAFEVQEMGEKRTGSLEPDVGTPTIHSHPHPDSLISISCHL